MVIGETGLLDTARSGFWSVEGSALNMGDAQDPADTIGGVPEFDERSFPTARNHILCLYSLQLKPSEDSGS